MSTDDQTAPREERDEAAQDPTRGTGAGTREGVEADPTRGGSAGTPENPESDPTRSGD